MKQSNRVKAAMRAGRKAYGYNLSFPSPWVIDILGKLDFDFVFIDGEHGPFGLDQLEDLCRTAERYNVTTIARVADVGSSTSPPMATEQVRATKSSRRPYEFVLTAFPAPCCAPPSIRH